MFRVISVPAVLTEQTNHRDIPRTLRHNDVAILTDLIYNASISTSPDEIRKTIILYCIE